MAAPGFWDNKDAAQAKMEESAALKAKINPLIDLEKRVEDLDVLIEFAEEGESDSDSLAELASGVEEVTAALDEFELLQFLNGPNDGRDCFVTIHAGAGGTEACDWADMLLRMYQRWAERRGFKQEILEYQEGEEAGVKSVTLRVSGENSFGLMQNERGVHRLVRISPFDTNNKRHTSFASLDVSPVLDEDVVIEVEEKDLKVDTFRSGGKGGQNVNKVETAVRMTHLPTGVVVACQAERSQLKNRQMAMRMLQAKLYQIEEDKKRSEMERQYGEKGEIAWGSQIRSYVFQPYQMVKDLRTGEETSNISAVMDGEIEAFIEAKLRGRKAGDSSDN